ncbi:glycoside hydrolase [Rickenella mellea]|uniref:Glycoside hydrolase n=1 Tax=Rickenella mellea TaxID=50990 RepID=A0A4Y7PT79_9AGAM|nr:glycoside hydrolase [Rickenella mellea]
MKLLLSYVSLAASLISLGSASFPGSGFTKGVNWPWGGGGAYGHWLSTELQQGYGPSYVSSDTTNAMSGAQQIGAKWMRIWLFESGQGLTVDGNRHVTGVRSDFWTNLDNVVSQANSHGIKLYPTLFTTAPGTGDMTKVANWFTDSTAQSMLLNNVILPFARRYSGNGAIAAIQLYNEMNGFTNSYFNNVQVTNAQAKTWISATVKAIKGVNGNYKVSNSQILINDQYHPASSSNKDYVGTGLDFYDIHSYSDNGSELPKASTFGLDQPVLLGEFGELTGEGDAHQSQVVSNFMNAARNGGWAGALYWTLGNIGNTNGMNCPDSKLVQSLYNCEGKARQAWTTFKNF